jgi:hypothetical protein
LLKLSDGQRVEQSVTARIADPRWEGLGREEQRKAATAVFEREEQKGVRVMTLIDQQSRVRVIATDIGAGALVTVH